MALSLLMHRRLQENKSQHLFSRMIPKRGQGASSTRFPGVVPTKPARDLGLFIKLLPRPCMASLPLRLGVVPFGDITVSLPSEHILRAPPLRHESNCRHCDAWTGAEESVNCSNGKYVLEPLLPLPPDITRLFQTRHFLTETIQRIVQFHSNGCRPIADMDSAFLPKHAAVARPSVPSDYGWVSHKLL